MNPWQSFGEFAMAVHQQCNFAKRDPRLASLASGINEGVGSEGGFLIPEQLRDDLLMRVYAAGLANRCTPWALTTASGRIPTISEVSRADGARYGGTVAGWSLEAAQLTPSKPTFGELRLEGKKLATVTIASGAEIYSDVPALNQYLQAIFTGETTFQLNEGIVQGTGIGQPLGVLNAGCTITVEKSLGQAASTITGSNVLAMWSRMWGASRDRAVWLVSESATDQVMALSTSVYGVGIDPGTSTPLPGTSANTIYGRPIIWTESCSALGTRGDIICADLSQYVIGSRGLRLASSIHSRFAEDLVTFKFSGRWDGQPTWAGPVTPKRGSQSLAPFITLATRA